ncbi:MAG: DUF805 domain-containing protein [Elusimicrobia bacterium]|nr:DUF805 domain-containing protein [Elusimicrobiota bacterium]
MNLKLGRLAYAFTAIPALIGAFVIAAQIAVERITSGWMGLLSLVLLIGAMFAASCRFRDMGRSAWWTLLIMVPIVGPLAALAIAVWPPKPSGTEE